MDDVLEHVCSTIIALACDGGFSQVKVADVGDGGVDTNLKNIEISCKVLRNQSVSYVTSLSWSLLCDLQRVDGVRTDPVKLAREMISRYSDGIQGMDSGREYIVGLLLTRAIHVVCSKTAGFSEDVELMESIRHVLMGPVYGIVNTEDGCWMHLVEIFVGAVNVSGCWDALIDIVKPTMEQLGVAEESLKYSCHIHMACTGIQMATSGAFVEYMHGAVFSQIVEYLKAGKSTTLPLVLLHDIIQSVATQGEEESRRMLGAVWNVCCKYLEPVDALGLLVQYVDAMIVTHVCEYDDENLWRVLQWGLLNQTGLQKKRGMYVLERLIEAMPSSMARLWNRFIQLCTALDDTSLHLFKAHWSEIELLHPEDDSERLPFSWIELIWRMAVLHQQPTAQKLALVSFLHRKWSDEDLRNISTDFISNTLISALGQASVYSGMHADDINAGIDVFFAALADSRGSDEAFCGLVTPFLKRMGNSQQYYVTQFCSRAVDIFCEQRRNSFQASAEFLQMIGAAAQAQPVFGSNYVSIACHRSLMRLAMLSFRIESTAEFEIILSWIGAIPNGLIYKGGILHEEGVSVFREMLSRSDFDIGSSIKTCMNSCDSTKRQCARRISALVKVIMLMCETEDDVLLEVSKYIESEILGQSEDISVNNCSLILSMMEAFVPLDGKKLLLSKFNEYIVAQCHMISSQVFPLIVKGAVEKIKQISLDSIHEMYEYCIDQRSLVGDVRVSNIEDLLPTSMFVYREAVALQVETTCNIIQAISLAFHEGYISHHDVDMMYDPICSILMAWIDRYQDIMIHSTDQLCRQGKSIDSLNLANHCVFEVKILGMRLLESIGESIRALQLATEDGLLKNSCRDAMQKTLVLSVESLKYVYFREDVESVTQEIQSNEKKKHGSRVCNSAQGWLSLCSWRSIAANLACLQGVPGVISGTTISEIVRYGRHCLYSAPDGNTAVMPIIRCFRCLIPMVVTEWEVQDKGTGRDGPKRHGFEQSIESILSSISSSLTHVMGTQTRGRLGLSAAIVSSVAHPFLFSSEALENPSIAAMHLKDGVIHSSICQLVSLGQKYNRLLIQVSCHLSSLLVEQPKLGIQYRLVIEELALSGFKNEASLLSLRDEVLDKTTATEMSQVMTNVPHEIATAYAQAECAPRVAIICLLYQWVQDAIQGDEDSMRMCRMLWESLYSLSKKDKDLSQTAYTHGGPIHKKKIRLWQSLAILSPCIDSSKIENQLKNIVEDMQSQNAMTVKQYQEIIGATLVIRKPELMDKVIFPAIDDYSSQRKDANPCLFSIISVVLSHFDGQHSGPEGQNHKMFPSIMNRDTWKTMLLDSLDHLLPWIGAFPHASRTFAQIIVWNLLKSYPEAGESNPLLKRIFLFLDSNKDLKRLHNRLGVSAGTLERFDVVNALSPTHILCNPNNALVRKVTKQQICENAPLPLVQEMLDYLLEQRQDTRDKVSDTMRKVGESAYQLNNESAVFKENEEAKNFWQRKITPKDQLQSALQMPWKHALGTSALQENRDIVKIDSFEQFVYQTETIEESNRQDIVVVASLIDKLPNLAGLTRTCEIFRAQKLILGDVSIQNDPEFATISVSANTWCPLEEVKPEHLSPWLQKMKHMGYRLVGLEQTDESVSLPEYTFDRKTVLILGAEKEGIPANILNLLDDTIEIPQLGLIRSLNVHVSAAITLYQYTCQK